MTGVWGVMGLEIGEVLGEAGEVKEVGEDIIREGIRSSESDGIEIRQKKGE